ncbi:MAG: 50S ribosomal protein L21 [Candidatus Dormibacteria bacterium]
MYAIVQVGGRQYRAAAGERLVVDRLDVEPGARVHLADVRMLIAEEGDGTETEIGRPRVQDVAVAARAISHFRGPKILVFKYKPKKRYRRHQGFRAELTELRIEEVRRGAYVDKPAPGVAKKRTPAPAKGPESAKAPAAVAEPTKVAEVREKAPVRRRAPAEAKAPGAGKAASAASVKAGATSAVSPPKATRAASKPNAKSPVPAKEKKVTRPRAKAAEKQEHPDGS